MATLELTLHPPPPFTMAMAPQRLQPVQERASTTPKSCRARHCSVFSFRHIIHQTNFMLSIKFIYFRYKANHSHFGVELYSYHTESGRCCTHSAACRNPDSVRLWLEGPGCLLQERVDVRPPTRALLFV